MPEFTAGAEYDRLTAVRVHRPGIETILGTLAPDPNLFVDSFNVRAAQQEHDRMVAVLEEYVDEVHYLEDDLAGEQMTELLTGNEAEPGTVTIDASDIDLGERDRAPGEVLWDSLLSKEAGPQFQMVLTNLHMDRRPHQDPDRADDPRYDSVDYVMEKPLSNIFFQRDQQFLGDKGPVMGRMAKPVRQPEVDVAEAAWRGIGADPVYRVEGADTLEGGEFIPAGDFALIGVDTVTRDVLRTTYGAAEQVLENEAVGYDEVGLVHAPLLAEKGEAIKHGNSDDAESDMDIMHLDTWFNIAADDVAVVDRQLAKNAVHIYENTVDGYRKTRSVDLLTYLDEQGFDIVNASFNERPVATNFMTLDNGVVLPAYRPVPNSVAVAPEKRTDEQAAELERLERRYNASLDGAEAGSYLPELNPVIEEMKQYGITVVPDGTGLNLENLTMGYGGIHCMTTPLNRE